MGHGYENFVEKLWLQGKKRAKKNAVAANTVFYKST